MDPQNQTPTPPPAQAEPPEAPATPPNSTPPAKKSYAKRPLWQWILIYVVVAVVVYGLIWLLFLRSSGSSGY